MTKAAHVSQGQPTELQGPIIVTSVTPVYDNKTDTSPRLVTVIDKSNHQYQGYATDHCNYMPGHEPEGGQKFAGGLVGLTGAICNGCRTNGLCPLYQAMTQKD